MSLLFVMFLFVTIIINSSSILIYFSYLTVFISTHGFDLFLILLPIPHFGGMEGLGRDQPCGTLLLAGAKL